MMQVELCIATTYIDYKKKALHSNACGWYASAAC